MKVHRIDEIQRELQTVEGGSMAGSRHGVFQHLLVYAALALAPSGLLGYADDLLEGARIGEKPSLDVRIRADDYGLRRSGGIHLGRNGVSSLHHALAVGVNDGYQQIRTDKSRDFFRHGALVGLQLGQRTPMTADSRAYVERDRSASLTENATDYRRHEKFVSSILREQVHAMHRSARGATASRTGLLRRDRPAPRRFRRHRRAGQYRRMAALLSRPPVVAL